MTNRLTKLLMAKKRLSEYDGFIFQILYVWEEMHHDTVP